jgi:hypothetical protein
MFVKVNILTGLLLCVLISVSGQPDTTARLVEEISKMRQDPVSP